MAKRSNGEGSIHKRPDGRWTAQLMVGYYPDGRRKVKTFYGATQKEVKERLQKYHSQLQTAKNVWRDISFDKWADVWYKNMDGQVAASTYEGYRYTLEHLKKYFGKTPLPEIKPLHIEECLKSMMGNGLSKSYVKKLRTMLFQIMKKAEANELILRNPVSLADKIRMSDTDSAKDSFTTDEIERLMTHLPNNRIGWSIRLMLGTGIRTGEMLALTPQHIEPDGSVLYIRQAVTMVKGMPYIGPPKTKNSFRNVPVPQSLHETAKKLRNTDKEYVWQGKKVTLCHPSVFRRQFKKAITEVGNVRLLSPHCCRHTYISQLQAMGVELETIKSLSGHAEVSMTEHYLHVQSEVKQAAAEKLDKLLASNTNL